MKLGTLYHTWDLCCIIMLEQAWASWFLWREIVTLQYTKTSCSFVDLQNHIRVWWSGVHTLWAIYWPSDSVHTLLPFLEFGFSSIYYFKQIAIHLIFKWCILVLNLKIVNQAVIVVRECWCRKWMKLYLRILKTVLGPHIEHCRAVLTVREFQKTL